MGNKKKIELPWVPPVVESDLEGSEYPVALAAALIGAKPARALREGLENKRHNDKYNIKYIGGTPKETRKAIYKTRPKLSNAVDSIAKRYNIDPEALKYRLNHEGFIDNIIGSNNDAYEKPYIYKYVSDDDLLFNPNQAHSGAGAFGLDDTADLIRQGKVKLINESWEDEDFINENGRKTHAASGVTNADNIGLVAATLKYHLDTAKANHPNYNPYDLNRAALIYYNRGQKGGEDYIKKGGTGYKYK